MQIKKAYHALKAKLHLNEMAAQIIETVQYAHRHVAHAIEAIATHIPPVMLLVESIGHIAAITQFRYHPTNKKALGFKVTTGVVMLVVAIVALALPQVSIPLIIAGLALDLTYQFFSIHHIHRKIVQLNNTLKTLPQQETQQHQALTQQLNKLNLIYSQQHQQRKEKIIRTAVSVITLVAIIAIFANPVTALPATIAALCATTAYLTYHFCKPLLKPAPTGSDNPDNKEAAAFLKSEEETLTDAKQDQETQVEQFFNHEDETLAKILHPKPEPTPQPKDTTKLAQEEEDEDGDGDGDGGESETKTETEETVELVP